MPQKAGYIISPVSLSGINTTPAVTIFSTELLQKTINKNVIPQNGGQN